jgi:hypothetical protein
MQLILLFPFSISCFGQQQKIVYLISFYNTLTPKAWYTPVKMQYPIKVDFSNPDTVYFTYLYGSKQAEVEKYTRRQNDEDFKNDKKDISGHKFMGVFDAPSLLGFSILLYEDEAQGLLFKCFWAPGNMLFAKYSTNLKDNPFKDVDFHPSAHGKVSIRDTVRLRPGKASNPIQMH